MAAATTPGQDGKQKGPEERMVVLYRGQQGEQQAVVGTSFTLPNPKNGQPQGFMLVGSQLLECQHFKTMHSAWFVGDRLVADGGLYMCTPIDPLFVLLPVLDRARNKGSDSPGVFCPLDQLVEGEGGRWPELPRLVALAADALRCVCDVKDVGGDAYYRLNADKALAWLRAKVAQARGALSAQLTGMDELGQRTYALGFLSEYLADNWAERLAKSLGVELQQAVGAVPQGVLRPAQNAASGAPPEKRQKVDPKEAAREAARKRAEEARQAVLAKQAAGTKKISSFFSPKPAGAGQQKS